MRHTTIGVPMPSLPRSVAVHSLPTGASVARFAELVNKIGTSPTQSSKKRKKSAQKKLKCVVQEQQRHAKLAGLMAVAVTLTYENNAEFAEGQLSKFIDCLRSSMRRAGYKLQYAWVLERAEQLHYHLIVWLPRSYSLDNARLARWWRFGSTWRESCETVHGWRKYMGKFNSIEKLPKMARVFGCGGLDNAGKAAVSRAMLPQWLQAVLPRGHHARRFPGEGWVDLATGELHHSPYLWTPWGAMLAAANPRACHQN
ncbi:rolling circle replication-associated protein [Burkholderia multivorans]|uniref:rolling circle replication-associated protein n=2 Tax=Burkholderia multivorans TaxID=87883 RepID=UPI003BAB3586